jgi:hypothetical protein
MADLETTYLVSDYAENPDYFQLHRRRDADMDLICSVAFPGESNWQAIDNHIVTAL